MPREAARDELADIIQVHQRALECTALMVQALRPVLLVQLVFCVFIWCLMMLYFTIAAEELTKCVYACGWPGMDLEIQQGLQMVLHRTQWPVGIQAGKFCFVDMERFQKMVNMSYSFFIVLKDAF
uniref:Odorant receptor n=1 Tax=Anopheles maculatus TaxID=74869 RepID=A0A182S7G6_9DIPT